MSRTAEFDVKQQVQLERFLNLAEKCISLGDGPVEPALEISVPINVRSTHGEARLKFVKVFSQINAGETFTLALAFSGSTLSFSAPLPLRLTPLEGRLLITAPVLFVGASGAMAIDIDLGRAHAALEISPERTPALFREYLAEASTAFIRPLGRRQFFRRLALVHSGEKL
ncbi:MAG TPA: hypothetical protein VFO34_02595 [Candidatus Acidoferrales bacterium]|nr:hypothetical protein [Candidatus Acidoferrales bacterium]